MILQVFKVIAPFKYLCILCVHICMFSDVLQTIKCQPFFRYQMSLAPHHLAVLFTELNSSNQEFLRRTNEHYAFIWLLSSNDVKQVYVIST